MSSISKESAPDQEFDLMAQLHGRIDQNENQKLSVKIKTLMGEFGFEANQRVRQSSLKEVTDRLRLGGIAWFFPAGTSANDYITLSIRVQEGESVERISLQPSILAQTTDDFSAPESPLSAVFHFEGSSDAEQSRLACQDMIAALWAFRPVCLVVEAPDEVFAFAGSYMAALMRRRVTMIQHDSDGSIPLAPEVITPDRLARLAGDSNGFGDSDRFPTPCGVYLVRDVLDQVRGDERVSFIREALVPHTYRLKSRPVTISPEYKRWVAAYAGALQLTDNLGDDELIEMSSLLAEATRLREALMDRQANQPLDEAFRSGFENIEHMVFKNALLTHLRERYPNDKIDIEQDVEMQGEEDGRLDEEGDGSEGRSRQRRRPDLRVPGKLWVEIETLRGHSRIGSNPFFDLEGRFRKKLQGKRLDPETWIVLPSDVVLLGWEQVSAVARHLTSALQKSTRLRWAFMDMETGKPVFLSPQEPVQVRSQLRGASWRESRAPIVERKLKWEDVAGYSDLKERLRGEILHPLREPERYAERGLGAANGLLLYGLPGCGKSLVGRVLAGEAGIACRRLLPSDLTSKWLGEGVEKVRELFDWALKHTPCLIVLDEVDAVAPQRREDNMHSDEKRQVNELLAQLDRISGKPVVVVATTNYVRGIDTAIRRSGRFDLKIPIFPPCESDRQAIFQYYLGPERLRGIPGASDIDCAVLAQATVLFTPADIKAVVERVARSAVYRSTGSDALRITTDEMLKAADGHQRTIGAEVGRDWLLEAQAELGSADKHVPWLEEELKRAYGSLGEGR